MNDMTPMGIGHNGAPDPIDAICAQYEGRRLAAESWADGAVVENEAQMKEADALRKVMRQWRLDLEAGQKSATAPLYDAYKAEGARWKLVIDDAKRIEGCLVAGLDGFKRRIAAEKADAERKAREEANRKMREAQQAAALANAADIEAQRAAADAAREAEEAQQRAKAASKDVVRGLRTVTKFAFEDPTEANPRGGHRLALNDIAQNDPEAITAFVEDYVRRHHKTRAIAGVRVWQEQEAF